MTYFPSVLFLFWIFANCSVLYTSVIATLFFPSSSSILPRAPFCILPFPPLPFILRSVVDASRCPRGVGGRLVDRPPFNGRPRPRNDGVLRVTRCLRFRAPVFARGRNKASVRRRGELFLLHSVLSAWQELTVTTFCLATPAQFLELMTSLALISG